MRAATRDGSLLAEPEGVGDHTNWITAARAALIVRVRAARQCNYEND